MSHFYDDMRLRDARKELRKLVDDGYECPCCRQFAKVYRRKLNSNMAYSLVVFFRKAGRGWGYKPDLLRGVGSSARDESLLRYWGLLEEETEKREDGGRAGFWRVTELGERFIRGSARVQSHARIYDGRCLGLVGEPLTIERALGKKFNYRELMDGV